MKNQGRGRFSTRIYPGARFGRLTVIERIPGGKGRRAKVRCRCDCGNISEPDASNLTAKNGGKSCGCRKKETGAENAKKRMISGNGYSRVISGAVFEKLTVIRRIEENGRLTNKVLCQCSCGKVAEINIDGLVNGTKSCGCARIEAIIARNKTSGRWNGFGSKYPNTYSSWCSMMNRCYNEKQKSYIGYGNLGVVVCEYLKAHPINLAKIIGTRQSSAPSLDRFPIHDGNYTCGKCDECKRNGWQLNIRWSTRKEQSENRGNFNVKITAFGRTMILSQWSELSGIDGYCISRRIERGWLPERALMTPDKKGRCLDLTLL